MALALRCYKAANNGNSTATSIATSFTGWTAIASGQTAPVAGDLLVAVVSVMAATQSISVSAGTAWNLQSSGNSNAGTEAFTSTVAWQRYASGNTAPTWAWSTSTGYNYTMLAIYDTAGGKPGFDGFATAKVDSSTATTHTANAATAGTAVDMSLILTAAREQTSGSHAISVSSYPSGWAVAGALQGYSGATGTWANCTSISFQTPVGTGSVAPGATTFNESLCANTYQILVSLTSDTDVSKATDAGEHIAATLATQAETSTAADTSAPLRIPQTGFTVLQSAGVISGNALNCDIQFSNNLTAGSKLIASVLSYASGNQLCTGVSDALGNQFAKAADTGNANSSGYGGGQLWYLDTPARDVGTKPVITATFDVNVSSSMAMVVQEVAGLEPGGSIDGTAATVNADDNTGAVSPETTATPSYSTSYQGEYLVSVLTYNNNTSHNPTYTTPAGYTLDPNSQSTFYNAAALVAYRASTGGTEGGAWSWTLTPGGSGFQGWGVISAAFRLATSAAEYSHATDISNTFGGDYSVTTDGNEKISPYVLFTAAGSPIQSTATSFSLTPAGVGDLIFLEVVQKDNATTEVSGLSSSNAVWTQAGVNFNGSTNAWTTSIWAGRVTSTSTATVTVSWTASTPATIRVVGQEFTAPPGPWRVDQQGNIDTPGTSTSAFASLTPSFGAGELYFGYAIVNGGATAGVTPGYTFFVDANGNALAFAPASPNVAEPPVWGSSNMQFGTMALIMAGSDASVVTDTTGTLVAHVTDTDACKATDAGEHIAATLATQAEASTAADSGTVVTVSQGGYRSYKSVVLADSPTLLWMLNETSGTTAADATGNGKTGTYDFTYTQGAAGPPLVSTYALSLAGGGFVYENASGSSPDTYSVECWINTTTAASQGIAGFSINQGSSGTYDRELYLDASANAGAFVYNNASSGWNAVSSGTAYDDGHWHHLVHTYNQATGHVQLFVDGILKASIASASPDVDYTGYWLAGSTGGVSLGNPTAPPNLSNDAYSGLICAFAVYPVELSAAQVNAHWSAGTFAPELSVAADGGENVNTGTHSVSDTDACVATDTSVSIKLTGISDASSAADSGTQIALSNPDASSGADSGTQITLSNSDASQGGNETSKQGPVGTDFSTATDAGEHIAATLSSSDTSSAADSGTQIAISQPDGSSGTDSSTHISPSDTDVSAATDSGTTIKLSQADSSSGTDNSNPVDVLGSDNSQATDAGEHIAATLSSSDSSQGTDSGTQIALSQSDASSGGDTGQLAISQTDTSQAADVTGTIALSQADASSGTEASKQGPAGTDFSTATDAGEHIAATLSSSDVAVSSDAGQADEGVSSTDAARATDAGESIAATLSSTDASTAADGSETIRVSSSDACSASSTETAVEGVTSSDVSSVTDAGEHITATLSSSDASQAADSSGSVAAILSSADAAAALEPPGVNGSSNETIHVHDDPDCIASDGGELVGVHDTDGSSAADAGNRIVLGDSDGSSGGQGGEGADLSDQDSSSAADGGESIFSGHIVTDTEPVRVVDSGFTFLSAADTCAASDGGEFTKLIPVPAATSDFSSAADHEFPVGGTQLVNDSDTCQGTESSWSSWPRDTDSCQGSDATPVLHRVIAQADASSVLDDEHETVEVWTYQPPFRWTGGGYEVVWHVLESTGEAVITIWRGPRPDRWIYALAHELATSTEVWHVHDDEGVSMVSDAQKPALSVSVYARPVLAVQGAVRVTERLPAALTSVKQPLLWGYEQHNRTVRQARHAVHGPRGPDAPPERAGRQPGRLRRRQIRRLRGD